MPPYRRRKPNYKKGKSGYNVMSTVYRRAGGRGGSLFYRKGLGTSKIKLHPNQQSIAWGSCPFPRELTTQVTYAENLQITSTAGVPNNYLFSTNGLYDPNITGVG